MALPAETLPQTVRMTVEDYLAFENEAEERHEYIDGEVVAMSGGTRRHYTLAGNVFATLHSQLRGESPCQPYLSGMRLRVDEALYTYPDVFVTCGSESFLEDNEITALDATLVVEVLSPSTETYDRGMKWTRYRSLPSLREYLMVSQDAVRIERYVRQDDGTWIFSETTDPDATLELDSIGARLAVADVYEDVFREGAAEDARETPPS